MSNEIERERSLRTLRMTVLVLTGAALAGIGLCYLYFVLVPYFPILAPGCSMSRILHLYCPGCGGTRAVAALLQGDLLTSLQSNPIVLWLLFLAAVQYLRAIRALIRRDPDACRLPNWMWISVIVFLLLFFVVRNLLLVCGVYDYLGDNLVFWTA